VTVTVVEWTSPPLVPVIVIVYDRFVVFFDVPTVNVDCPLVAPDRFTPVGLKLRVIPLAAGDTVELRLTRPVNPFAAVTVTVKVVDEPRATLRLPGVTAIVKSGAGGGALGVAERSLDSVPVPALLIAATL
jgi:hypothetical protein